MSSRAMKLHTLGLLSRPAAAEAGGNPWDVAGKTCVAAYQPIGAASLAASYVNLANPGTYDLAVVTGSGAPTWTAETGWDYSPGTGHHDTGVVPNPTAAGDWSFLVRFSDAVALGVTVAGCSSDYEIQPRRSIGDSCVWAYDTPKYTSPGYGSGVIGFAGNLCYYNGILRTTHDGTWVGNAATMTIGARHTNKYFDGKVQALYIYSDTLTALEMAAKSTIMAALS